MKTLKLSGNMVAILIDRATGECVVDATQQAKNEARAVLAATQAIAEAIRALGSVPSGVLYARVMAHMDLSAYDGVIGLLKNCGLVAEAGHILTWTGPKLDVKPENVVVSKFLTKADAELFVTQERRARRYRSIERMAEPDADGWWLVKTDRSPLQEAVV